MPALWTVRTHTAVDWRLLWSGSHQTDRNGPWKSRSFNEYISAVTADHAVARSRKHLYNIGNVIKMEGYIQDKHDLII